MSQIKDIKEKRGAKLKELETLNTELTKTDLTTEVRSANQATFVTLTEEIEALTGSIEREEKFDQARLRMAGNMGGAPVVDSAKNEIAKSFSFARAAQIASNLIANDGFEKEMHQEAVIEARQFGQVVQGIGIPAKVLRSVGDPLQKRTGMNATTNADGAYAVPTLVPSLIEALWAQTFFDKVGIALAPGQQANYKFPKNSTAAASWATETATGGDLTPVIGSLTLAPKRLAGKIDISKQLLLENSIFSESYVQNQLIRSFVAALETASVSVATAASAPIGITVGTAAGNVLALGTNGVVPTYANLITLMGYVAAANANVGTKVAFLTTPGMNAKLQGIQKFATYGEAIVSGGQVNGVPIYNSGYVPSNTVKGSSGAICHTLIYGNFDEFMVMQWGGFDLTMDPFTQALSGNMRVVANSFFDMGLKHDTAFGLFTDGLI